MITDRTAVESTGQKVELDQMTFFWRPSLWKSENEHVANLNDFLVAHGEDYASSPISGFLYQLKSVECLKFFNPFLSRDGALTLFDFFLKNPVPLNTKVRLSVSPKLLPLVPQEWSSQVFFHVHRTQTEIYRPLLRKNNVILILSAFGTSQANLDFVQSSSIRALQRIQQMTGTVKIQVLSAFPRVFPKDFLRFDSQSHFANAVKVIIDVFGEQLEFINENEISGISLSQSYVHDLNQSDFFYSDSSVIQKVLRSGGSHLFPKDSALPTDRLISSHPLSLCHQVDIYRKDNQAPVLNASDYREMQTSINQDEKSFCEIQKIAIIKDIQKFYHREFN